MRPHLAALAAIGLLSPAMAADEKTPAAKAQVKGSFTMNGATYRMANAVAYTMTVDEKKRTVIVLSDKPLDAAQLKASLKKHGTAEEFDPKVNYVELTFDDKGAFQKIWMQTQDAGIRHLPAGDIKDHKGSATTSDSGVKGSAVTLGKENRKAINGHLYQFDLDFNVPLTKP